MFRVKSSKQPKVNSDLNLDPKNYYASAEPLSELNLEGLDPTSQKESQQSTAAFIASLTASVADIDGSPVESL